jgi:hypothetical protein
MSNYTLAIAIACSAMLATLAVAANAAGTREVHFRAHRGYYVWRPLPCPLHRTVDGEWADCRGWRLRDNAIGWDSSCLNLDYLPSQFACSSGGGR